MECVFQRQHLQLFCLKLNRTYMSNFQPLEVVGRGSETQLQVGENINKTIQCLEGYRVNTQCHNPKGVPDLTLSARGSSLDVRI